MSDVEAQSERGAGTDKPSDTEFVYYDSDDCAGFVRRLIAMTVDLVVVLVCSVVLVVLLVAFGPEEPDTRLLWGPAFAGSFVYLTLVKRSAIRTIGYWVTGLRIVNLRGERPALFFMILRLAWWLFGPLNPVIDFLFMGGEPQRQTLRDKLFGTYVIRRHAKPAGYGRRVVSRWGFMGMFFLFPVVQPTEEQAGTEEAA